MYLPHEAREDTVIYPAYRSLLSPSELHAIATTVADDQIGQFGADGYAATVERVSSIEEALGIANLAQFTPPPPL
jgi:hypothetical protein